MLLKTNQTLLYGQKINLPIVGEVEIDENGQLDIDEEVAVLLLQSDGWDIVQDDIEIQQSQDLGGGNTGTVKTIISDEKSNKAKDLSPEIEDSEFSKELDNMSLEDMISMAKEAKLTGYNLFMKDKSKMKVFLLKKLK